MPRFDRLFVTPPDWDVPIVEAPIPGLAVTRPYGSGPILALAGLNVLNTSNFEPHTIGLFLRVNGVPFQYPGPLHTIPINSTALIPYVNLVDPGPGTHLVELLAYGDLPAILQVLAAPSTLLLIELPEWQAGPA